MSDACCIHIWPLSFLSPRGNCTFLFFLLHATSASRVSKCHCLCAASRFVPESHWTSGFLFLLPSAASDQWHMSSLVYRERVHIKNLLDRFGNCSSLSSYDELHLLQSLANAIALCAGSGSVPDARWTDLASAAAAADQPSTSSTNPRLTTQQAARRPAHKVLHPCLAP